MAVTLAGLRSALLASSPAVTSASCSRMIQRPELGVGEVPRFLLLAAPQPPLGPEQLAHGHPDLVEGGPMAARSLVDHGRHATASISASSGTSVMRPISPRRRSTRQRTTDGMRRDERETDHPPVGLGEGRGHGVRAGVAWCGPSAE